MNDPFVTIDLHGKTQAEAVRIINRALSAAGPGVYQIRLVHGFHRGTNLRDMIWDEYRYHKKVLRVAPGDNPGITALVLRELY
ncbi:MAG: Smr/MutS family protein [Clostridia bacterium]|nr:Smr/MutS family protein [Clostridia bacterium]